MIDPSECFAAPVRAAMEMTLVLPRNNYEWRSLIVTGPEQPILICLDDYPRLGRYLAFPCQENERWQGLHVPGVRVELDETSLFDADLHYPPMGSMLRTEDKLMLSVNFEGQFPSAGKALIRAGLPSCAPRQSACFLKWQVVLGEGEKRRVLWRVDATPSAT